MSILESLKGSLKVSERSRDIFGGLLSIGRHDVTLTHIVECTSHQRVSFENGVVTLVTKDPLPKGRPTPEIYFRFSNKSGDYISTYRPTIGFLKAGDITVELAKEKNLRLEESNGTAFYVDLNGERVQGKRATQDALDQIRDIADGCGLETFDHTVMVGKTLSIEVFPRPEYNGEIRLEAGYFRPEGNKSICYRAPKDSKAVAKTETPAPTEFTSPDDLPY